MTVEEAWKIVNACKGWNEGQKSVQHAFGGPRTAEDDILDARRSALKKAWQIIEAAA